MSQPTDLDDRGLWRVTPGSRFQVPRKQNGSEAIGDHIVDELGSITTPSIILICCITYCTDDDPLSSKLSSTH